MHLSHELIVKRAIEIGEANYEIPVHPKPIREQKCALPP